MCFMKKKMSLYTNMRGVETRGTSFQTTNKELMVFFGCSMLISIFNLPRIRMNWARKTRIPNIADNMPRNRYFVLRANLKVIADTMVTQRQNQF